MKRIFKKISGIIFLILLLIILAGCSSQKPTEKKQQTIQEQTPTKEQLIENIIDINIIINKDLVEIEKILGASTRTEEVSISDTICENNPCNKEFFQSEKYEIVFINNKASLITINPQKEYRLTEKSIELLKLPQTKPSAKNDKIFIRWEDINGIKEITFFKDTNDNIDYIYIKTN